MRIITTIAVLAIAGSTIAAPADSLQHIDEVVVTGTRQPVDVRHLPQTVSIVTRDCLVQNHRTNILPTLTEQVPGLLATSRGMMGYGVSTGASGGMMLRGISSAAGQMMVLIDGHPQYNGIYGHSIADSYQTMMADRVEVLRGPASVLYGSNAMGGVVNIVTRGMLHDGIETVINLGAGSYGTVEAEASNQYRYGKFSSTVAVQYGRSDNHRPDMGFEQWGGYAKLNYGISTHWNAYADIDITHFNASYPGTVTEPMIDADQWITRGAVALGVENHYGKTTGRLSVYDNFGRHKINDGYAVGKTPKERYFQSSDALMGVSLYQNMNLWRGGRVTLGFDYQNIYGHTWYTNMLTGEEEENGVKQSADVRNDEFAGYMCLRQEILGYLTLDLGTRYDHHSVVGGELVPQVGVVVRPMETGEVKLMMSKGFRNPTTKEMYLYPPSNEELKPERLWNYELSWRHHLLGGSLVYAINLFMIDADNVIQTVNRKNVNTGELHNRGLEIDASWRIDNHWSLTTNHSWLHMKEHVVSAPEYKGYIGGTWHNTRWTASAGLMQVSDLFTAIGDNEKKESFTLLNMIIAYQACKLIGVWLKGDNLLAQRYEFISGMPMPKATFMGGVTVKF